jgi:hypothetical protein
VEFGAFVIASFEAPDIRIRGQCGWPICLLIAKIAQKVQGKWGVWGVLEIGRGAGELGLIGFVLNNVRWSLFVVHWHKPLVLLHLWSYYPF